MSVPKVASAMFSIVCSTVLFAGLSRAQVITVPVLNASFESGNLTSSASGTYSQLIAGSTIAGASGTTDSWIAASNTTNAAAGSFGPTVGGNNWPTKFSSPTLGYLQVSGAGTVSLSQTLAATLQNDMTYSLGYFVGKRTYTPRFSYSVQLWAGTALLVADNSHAGNTAPFLSAASKEYDAGPNDANAGKTLRIVLTCTGVDGIFTEAFFDEISLLAIPKPLVAPTIRTGGVGPVFSSSSTIQPGSWISIYGSDFATGTSIWNNDFPLSLGGVSVTVNSKPAYLWFVNRHQINLQAPSDNSTGPVLVTVSTAMGKASAAVVLGQFGPSFSLLNEKYAAAIVVTPGFPGNSGGGYDIVAPTGAFVYPTRPVRGGEILILYGVGFGPTSPSVPAGVPYTGAAQTVSTPTITIGGVPAAVHFAGIVAAGLYQFNVVVPSTGSGDQPLRALVGGLSTPDNVFVTVQ
jgi:uncharacterized protein (TIGR03437 family)